MSYDGRLYELLEHTYSTHVLHRLAKEPESVPIEVLYAALRPPATHGPQHMLSSHGDAAVLPSVGDFVFYSHAQTRLVNAGMVM